MTGQLIFLEYGWSETLISDNGPCYTVEAFTSLMNAYYMNHITNSPHYPQSNGLAEKYIQIVKRLFYKAKEESKNLFKCLMIYCITPLSGSLQAPMQILQSRSIRTDLPVSNVVRQQLGLQSEKLRNVNKNDHLPSHDLLIGQEVKYQDATSKQWYPATITSLCVQPRSYNITTREGVTYRKTQTHLKPFKPQNKKSDDESSDEQSSDMQTLTQTDCKKFNSITIRFNLLLDQRGTLSPQLNLICEVLCK